MRVDVSFIIVNYCTARLIQTCVQSIRTFTGVYTYEILIVDNHSPDDSLLILGELEDIRLIANTDNDGFGKANNMAAAEAEGKYLFFINPDAYLLSDATSRFIDYLERHASTRIAALGADLQDETGHKQMSYGNFPSLMEVFSYIGFYRFWPEYHQRRLSISKKNSSEEPIVVDYILGAAMFFRADVFKELGGFDEDFFLYFEETELAYRVWKAGYSIWLLPEVRIVHPEGNFDRDGALNYSKLKWFERGRQLYFKKTKGVVVAFVVKVLLSIHALVLAAFRRDKQYLKLFRIIVAS